MEVTALFSRSHNAWPGRNSAVVFVPGCNFECHYCNAHALVRNAELLPRLELEKVFETIFAEKELRGVVVTGGEPLLQREALVEFLDELKAEDVPVKLDTNGSDSDLLSYLIEEELVDYVALDVKHKLNDYSYFKACGNRVDLYEVAQSIQLLKHSDVDYEFRTTVVPKLHSFLDIQYIARALHGGKRYVLQQFSAKDGTLDKNWSTLPEMPYDKLVRWASQLKGIQEVRVRTPKGDEIIETRGQKIVLQ
ncbi:MAG: anaerobic ribonucleoside-triphosphate reductase activating protein [Candidatus Diapherotrites archaeon]